MVVTGAVYRGKNGFGTCSLLILYILTSTHPVHDSRQIEAQNHSTKADTV